MKTFISNPITTISLLAFLMAGAMASPVQATNNDRYNSDLNKPSYWGEQCEKTEFNGEVYTYNADSNATKVIIKGGTTNKVYTEGPFTNLTAEVNERNGKTYAISHVIVCYDEVDDEDEDEVCEFNSSILSDDPACKESTPNPTDDPSDEPNSDDNGVTLGTTTEQPSILPVTGPVVMFQTLSLGVGSLLAQYGIRRIRK